MLTLKYPVYSVLELAPSDVKAYLMAVDRNSTGISSFIVLNDQKFFC